MFGNRVTEPRQRHRPPDDFSLIQKVSMFGDGFADLLLPLNAFSVPDDHFLHDIIGQRRHDCRKNRPADEERH